MFRHIIFVFYAEYVVVPLFLTLSHRWNTHTDDWQGKVIMSLPLREHYYICFIDSWPWMAMMSLWFELMISWR